MSGGLVALLDDIAALARAAAASVDDVAAGAAKASAKTAGVVIDDAAVTPQYVTGVSPQRELPMIWKIARGSIRNKLLIILPILLLLSHFAVWALTPLLMLGGTYLCYEGAEKVWGSVRGRRPQKGEPSALRGAEAENKVVKGAITTDFILSCEIMVIALNEVLDQGVVSRAVILIVVALAMTAAVYGAVALIVKMDDIGLHLTTKDSSGVQKLGRSLVTAMPVVLSIITVVGTVAMLWVGGHIMMVGLHDLGWPVFFDVVHTLETPALTIAGAGPLLAWLINTACSAVLGVVWGLAVYGLMHAVPMFRRPRNQPEREPGDLRARVAGHRPDR